MCFSLLSRGWWVKSGEVLQTLDEDWNASWGENLSENRAEVVHQNSVENRKMWGEQGHDFTSSCLNRSEALGVNTESGEFSSY